MAHNLNCEIGCKEDHSYEFALYLKEAEMKNGNLLKQIESLQTENRSLREALQFASIALLEAQMQGIAVLPTLEKLIEEAINKTEQALKISSGEK